MSEAPVVPGPRVAGCHVNDRGVSSAELIHVQLTADERVVLRAGLLDWGGPARPTDAFATAMGFTDAGALPKEARASWQQIHRSSSLTAEDWRRVPLAVEIVFVSDVVGSGLDWRFTAGFSDAETIGVVRELQPQVASVARQCPVHPCSGR